MNVKEVCKKYGIEESRLQRRMTGIVEWTCKHGIGHPIPESAREVWKHYNGKDEDYTGKDEDNPWFVHGCDGCCEIFR